MAEFTDAEKMAMVGMANWHLTRLRDDYNDMFGRDPDKTTFWQEQISALSNHIDVWESIRNKLNTLGGQNEK